MEFVALDFETADQSRQSPCEVSVIRFSKDKVVDTFSTLIRPHPSVSFLERNTLIHGIRSKDVKDSPEFPEVLPKLLSFIAGSPLVAHSASFDISVIFRTAEFYKIDIDTDLHFYCSRVLAERDPSFELTSYSLAALCSAFNIVNLDAHRAESDAIACAELTYRLATRAGFSNLPIYAESLGIGPGLLSKGSYKGLRVPRGARFPSAMSKAQADAFLENLDQSEIQNDEDFSGREVVFTGKLTSMERIEAQELVLKAGGTSANSITRRTSLVVVGQPYDSDLLDETRISGKLQKVLELRSKGSEIDVVTEEDFLRMIAD